MRDVLLVAAFEILRAARTWRAAALVAIYGVASGGATYLFTRLVGALENTLASQLGVAATDTPGAMLDELVKSELWRDFLERMSDSPQLVDRLVEIPPLALFHLWFGFLVVPFFAASAAAECVSIDVQSRAIRYELQRTSRVELALGRFVGQLAITAGAAVASAAVAYAVGLGFMRGHDPFELATALLATLPRTWSFGVPFVAIGAGASLWTRSPAWSRTIAVSLAAGSWVLYGVASWASESERWAVLADLTLQILPQGWIRGLWAPGAGWLPAGAACAAIAFAILALGIVRFSRRDL